MFALIPSSLHTYNLDVVYKSLLSIVTLELYNMCDHETPHDRVCTREHRKSTQVNQVGQTEHAKALREKTVENCLLYNNNYYSFIKYDILSIISVFHLPPKYFMS